MSFRRYGGINYNARNNITRSSYNTSTNLSVTGDVGQPNSYITFLSDISGDIIIYGNLDVSGNCSAAQFLQTSDYRIKENVTTLNESYVIDNLRPVSYLNKKLNKQDIGFIAHEVQEVYPELVNGEKDGSDLQSVNYTGLIPILIKEVQELKKENKILNERLTILENK